MPDIGFITRKQNSRRIAQGRFHGAYTIDNSRISEEDGLAASPLTKTNELSQADIVFTRLNPERTNRRALKRVAAAEERAKDSALILNSVRYFNNYADKATCFNLWNQHNLQSPRFYNWAPWAPLKQQIQATQKALAQFNGLYLRTSNEDSGKGICYLPGNANQVQIKSAIRFLQRRTLTNKVSDSRIMAVEGINNRNSNGISHVFRVHIACGQILGGYALVGTKAVIHAKDQSIDNWTAYIEENERLRACLKSPEFRSMLLEAVSALKADIGALEFFLIDEKPVFLEFNPLWGGTHRFGDPEFNAHLLNHTAMDELEEVRKWLNPGNYYKTLYETIFNHWQSLGSHKN